MFAKLNRGPKLLRNIGILVFSQTITVIILFRKQTITDSTKYYIIIGFMFE